MDDKTERTLLAALDTHPSDPGVRQVYGDWLEQHGYSQLAAFVRGSDDPSVVAESNLMWRAITSRARLVCDNQGCPGSWDRLESTDHCQVRGCRTCNECVVYCGSVNEALRAGEARLAAAFDLQDHAEIARAYDRRRAPWKYGTWNPPPAGRIMRRPVPPAKSPFEKAVEVLDDATGK
jgi:uncharacterized protein (TIGR02996 family)